MTYLIKFNNGEPKVAERQPRRLGHPLSTTSRGRRLQPPSLARGPALAGLREHIRSARPGAHNAPITGPYRPRHGMTISPLGRQLEAAEPDINLDAPGV